jgi:hypothetical protein
MLYEDEDDIFMGSPKSKFFDILFNANRTLVKEKLLEIIERYNAMEMLLEQTMSPENLKVSVDTVLLEQSDEIFERNNDFFIATVGEILTQNE